MIQHKQCQESHTYNERERERDRERRIVKDGVYCAGGIQTDVNNRLNLLNIFTSVV